MLKSAVCWDSEAVNSNNNVNINAEKSCLTLAISLLISRLLWDFRKHFGVSSEQSTSSLVRCFVSAIGRGWGGRYKKRQPKGLLVFEIDLFDKTESK